MKTENSNPDILNENIQCENSCIFCGGQLNHIYYMKQYSIVQCSQCFTTTVENKPTSLELERFYKGFTFNNNINIANKMVNPGLANWIKSLNLPKNAKMLDVGGGGGSFAYAFNQLGFGESYYIDLDEESCKFAKNELKIEHVVHGDAIEYCNMNHQLKFDFIYCRHLIEHLINPLKLIESIINSLSSGNVFVLQFPNGRSWEYLGYPKLLRKRAEIIYDSNQEWSKFKTIRTLFSNRIAHGIDPPRHLWAISSKGIESYLLKNIDIQFKVYFAPLNHPVFSPYFQTKTLFSKSLSFIVNNTLARLHGGTHLIIEIKKKS
jgi:2-polyprenyl-3-methyl-5-hydroxy-6-metoxy-1,4-benzoquinol methylase